MVNGKCRWVNNLLTILFTVSFCACTSSSVHDDNLVSTADDKLLESGDIIYRHGNGIFSGYFKNTSQKEQLYSHAGIVLLENDSLFVIHSEASEFTGIGGVKKEPLTVFLSDISTWGVYRLDTVKSVRDSVVVNARKYLDADAQFDFDFDSDDDSKIYCTELIALSINKSMHRSIIQAKGRFANKSYFAVDDTYMIPQMKNVIKHHSED